jgi:membrane-bound serine protease (ClpP class)
VAIFMGVFFGFVVSKALAMRHLPAAQGAEAVVGREGVVLGEGLDPDGVVRVAAEEWRAIAPHPLPPGAKVRVTKLDGLVLTVEPLDLEHAQSGGAAPAQGGNH